MSFAVRYDTRCSYRVRGIDGNCAKHLTVESYTVVMLLTLILIIPAKARDYVFTGVGLSVCLFVTKITK